MTIRGVIGPVHFRSEDFLEQEQLLLLLMMLYMSVLGDLNVPIIFDSDIGHKGPQSSVIMGAKAKVTSKNGKGVLEYA